MKNFISFFKQIITSNTGVSSTRFNLVYIGVVVIMLLLILGFVLVYDVLSDGTITTDLNGVAAIIGSLTALLTAVGLTKVGDTFGKGRYNKHNNDDIEK